MLDTGVTVTLTPERLRPATVPVRHRREALHVGRREGFCSAKPNVDRLRSGGRGCQFTEVDGNEVPAVELLCQT